MLQNLPEGETDKSYDKTINLIKIIKKVFRTFVSNHYLHILYANGNPNCRHECDKF